MAYPSGVRTVTLSFGRSIRSDGTEVATTLTVVPVFTGTRTATWAASGTSLLSSTVTYTAAAGEMGYVQLPVTDQPGWVDDSQAPYTGWSYKLTEAVAGGGENRVKFFSPLRSQSEVDFDLIPLGTPGTPAPGVTAPVISVNGKTGAVVLDADADLQDALEKTGSGSAFAVKNLVNRGVFMVPIYGNSLRNYPGTSNPVALWQTVLWVSNSEPVNKQPHDIWFEQGATPPTGPADPVDVGFVTSAFNRGNGSSVTSITVNLPSGIQPGDLILVTGQGLLADNPMTLTSSLTFTSHGSNARTGITSNLWSRVAASADATQLLTFTVPTAAALSVGVAVFRPSVPIKTVASTNQASGSNTIVVPPFTPSSTSRAIQVVHIARGSGAAATLTPPVGVTMVASALPVSTAAPRSGIAFGLGTVPNEQAGNVWTNTSDHYASTWLVTLDVTG